VTRKTKSIELDLEAALEVLFQLHGALEEATPFFERLALHPRESDVQSLLSEAAKQQLAEVLLTVDNRLTRLRRQLAMHEEVLSALARRGPFHAGLWSEVKRFRARVDRAQRLVVRCADQTVDVRPVGQAYLLLRRANTALSTVPSLTAWYERLENIPASSAAEMEWDTTAQPDSTRRIRLRGIKQRSSEAVLWIDAPIEADASDVLTAFVIDHSDDVMESMSLTGPWPTSALLELRFADTVTSRISRLQVQIRRAGARGEAVPELLEFEQPVSS
jgi:hypothetical protein